MRHVPGEVQQIVSEQWRGPIVPQLLAGILDRGHALMQDRRDAVAADPRLIAAMYRAAVATGVMDAAGVLN
nr:hypothetical protein [uncultured Rhodopila sp.]